jgi:hypothetical protein
MIMMNKILTFDNIIYFLGYLLFVILIFNFLYLLFNIKKFLKNLYIFKKIKKYIEKVENNDFHETIITFNFTDFFIIYNIITFLYFIEPNFYSFKLEIYFNIKDTNNLIKDKFTVFSNFLFYESDNLDNFHNLILFKINNIIEIYNKIMELNLKDNTYIEIKIIWCEDNQDLWKQKMINTKNILIGHKYHLNFIYFLKFFIKNYANK